MAGKGGGAWKVAYADFVTAMMAFFMVLWITGQNQEVKEAVSEYFLNPYRGFTNGSHESPGKRHFDPTFKKHESPRSLWKHPPKETSALEKSLKDTPPPKRDPREPKKPTVFSLHDGKYAYAGTIFTFEPGQVALDENALSRLNELLPSLKGKRNKIEIRAHSTRQATDTDAAVAAATDASALESSATSDAVRDQKSWQLCFERCQATMKWLEEHGIDRDRLRLSQAGPFEPYTLQEDPELQAQNARVEVYMLNESVKSLQGTKRQRDERAIDVEPQKATASLSHTDEAHSDDEHGNNGDDATQALDHASHDAEIEAGQPATSVAH